MGEPRELTLHKKDLHLDPAGAVAKLTRCPET